MSQPHEPGSQEERAVRAQIDSILRQLEAAPPRPAAGLEVRGGGTLLLTEGGRSVRLTREGSEPRVWQRELTVIVAVAARFLAEAVHAAALGVEAARTLLAQALGVAAGASWEQIVEAIEAAADIESLALVAGHEPACIELTQLRLSLPDGGVEASARRTADGSGEVVLRQGARQTYEGRPSSAQAALIEWLHRAGISAAVAVEVAAPTDEWDGATPIPSATLDLASGTGAWEGGARASRELVFGDGSTALLHLSEADAPGDVTASFERIDVGSGCDAAFIAIRGRGAEVYAARVASGRARLDVPSAALERGQRTVYLVRRPSPGHDAGAIQAELRPRDTLLALRRDKPAGQGREIGAQLVVGEASIELALTGRGEWYAAPLPPQSGIDLDALGVQVRVGDAALDAFVLDDVFYVASPRWAISAWRPKGVKVLCRGCREWQLTGANALPAEGAAAREPVIALFDCACGTRNALIVCHDDLGLDAPVLWGEDPVRARAIVERVRAALAAKRQIDWPRVRAIAGEVALRERDRGERGADVRIAHRRSYAESARKLSQIGSGGPREPERPVQAQPEDLFLGVVVCHACRGESRVEGERSYVGRERPEWADEEPYLLAHACAGCQAETFALVGPADLGDRGARLFGFAADAARARAAELRRLKALSPRALAELLQAFLRRAPEALDGGERELLAQLSRLASPDDLRDDDLDRQALVLRLRCQKEREP